MRFRRGNKAILEHANDGKDLMLFEHLGKGQGYRYVGAFACSSFEYGRSHDINGLDRSTIRFHLIPISGVSDSEDIAPDDTSPNSLSLQELRERAMQASSDVPERHAAEAKAGFFRRSAQIKLYVLARAQGNCEACNQPAPFLKKNGAPYLEPHHTRRLSDGGPDDPRWVAAICPTCHRRIHHGQGGEYLNRRLQEVLRNSKRDSANQVM